MKIRHGIAMAFGITALVSSLMSTAPAQAQSYGGNTVDCYISVITAPSPLRSGESNLITARGGNHGTVDGSCTITGSISRVGGGYTRAFRTVTKEVPKDGTFQVSYTDKANKPGEYRIEVCATATGPDATHPADDCKTITRDATGQTNNGKVDCYVGSISAPSRLQTNETNKVLARGGNKGTASGTCQITGSIKRSDGGYSRDFRTLNLTVAKGGTFQVEYRVTPRKTGKYTIQVCAKATGGNATNPGNDCKSITRSAV